MTETDGVQCLLRSPTGEGRVINSLLRWHHSAYTRQQMADDKSQQFSSVYQRWRLVWRTDTDLRDWQKTQGGRRADQATQITSTGVKLISTCGISVCRQ